VGEEIQTGHGGGRNPVLGAVLAGGIGSRLGGAKATAQLAGRALISYPLAAFAAAGIEPVVVAKRDSELPPLDCPVLREPDRPRHPLCGILAALRKADGRAVVVVGCDMPFVEPSLLGHLARATDPLLVPELGGRAQPLPGRYQAELLPELEAAVDRRAALRETIASLGPRLLAERELRRFGDPNRMLFNLNEPADLRAAERYLAGQAGGD
jgi:molybdopterin-guanine dinucleotide biosynthesis protein A